MHKNPVFPYLRSLKMPQVVSQRRTDNAMPKKKGKATNGL